MNKGKKKQNKAVKEALLLALITLVSFSCNKEDSTEPFEPETCVDTISYSNEIEPQIINKSCNVTGCHDATASGGYSFTSHTAVSNNADAIYGAITHQPAYTNMPKNGSQLADSLLQKFYCWKEQGTPNN